MGRSTRWGPDGETEERPREDREREKDQERDKERERERERAQSSQKEREREREREGERSSRPQECPREERTRERSRRKSSRRHGEKKGLPKRPSGKKASTGEEKRKASAVSPAPAAGARSPSVRSSSPGVRSEVAKSEDSTRDSPRRSATPSPRKPVEYAHRRTAGEVLRCKKAKRTDIKPQDWAKFSYAKKEEVLRRPIVYEGNTVPIPRVKRKDITPQWFFENVASKGQPIIVEDVCNDWPAMQRWSLEAMEERFRHVAFKVAKDDKGKKLRMKFKYYADYVRRQQDDSPLYLFETNVDDNAYIRALVNDFEVPDIFPHDWMNLLNHDSRPPYRWFCIGPKRSGTTVHTDPLGTAAWNAVSHGCKRWVLFEPGESRKIVKGKDVIKDGEDDEAIMYFDFILPRIKKAHPDLKIYEGLQNPGEVIFVPGDWWHGVLNLEDTVAITQNYVGPDNFDVVWKKTRKEREKVAYLWLRNMKKVAPRLYEHALSLNRQDKFRMRHEREKGERLSSCSSSSSESSSDSTSDTAEDLNPFGLKDAVLDSEKKLGAAAFTRQGPGPLPMLVSSGFATFDKPGKRQRTADNLSLA